MSEVWPLDAKKRLLMASGEAIRPFKCLLLMPFESRFNQVADIIKETVEEVVKNFAVSFQMEQPIVNRLDWVTSSGVIQQQVWQEILEADLVFCDITGFNANVMFEAGVCAAWKNMSQVAFIKDRFFRQQSAFDIAPIRYSEYELTSDGINPFRDRVAQLTQDALIAFPDAQGPAPEISLPLHVDFSGNNDDLRIFTPSFAHRRVINDALEFGSPGFFSHSWASVGKERFLHFKLEFSARFVEPMSDAPKIGVALRSQHYYANFGHHFSIAGDGSVWITEPHNQPPNLYDDTRVREPTDIDLDEFHLFKADFTKDRLLLSVDDFEHEIEVANMRKVFGPGLIRLYSVRSLMAIRHITVEGL